MAATMGNDSDGPGLTTRFCLLFGSYGNGIRLHRFRMLRVDGRQDVGHRIEG